MGISFPDFFDFLYLSILLLVLKKKYKKIKIYVCLDSSLESVKHIFKNNEFGKIYIYIYIFFLIIGPWYEGFRQFFFFLDWATV